MRHLRYRNDTLLGYICRAQVTLFAGVVTSAQHILCGMMSHCGTMSNVLRNQWPLLKKWVSFESHNIRHSSTVEQFSEVWKSHYHCLTMRHCCVSHFFMIFNLWNRLWIFMSSTVIGSKHSHPWMSWYSSLYQYEFYGNLQEFNNHFTFFINFIYHLTEISDLRQNRLGLEV
jgi:hypothetical protein